MASTVGESRIKNLMNAILVKDRVRPAMLLANEDLEDLGDVMNICGQNGFAGCRKSDRYEINQGPIISYHDYDGMYISLNDMGEILGYPCHREYMWDMFKHKSTRVVTIVVDYTLNGISRQAQLIANICDSNITHLDAFEKLAQGIGKALRTPESTRILSQYSGGKLSVDHVRVYQGADRTPTFADRMSVKWSSFWSPTPNRPAEDENRAGDFGCKFCRKKMRGMTKRQIREQTGAHARTCPRFKTTGGGTGKRATRRHYRKRRKRCVTRSR